MKCKKMRFNSIIILVPYPSQGHVTPMLKLASAFLSQGFKPVLVTPEYIHNQIVPKVDELVHSNGLGRQVLCMPIPDGLDKDTPRDFFSIEKAMENNMPSHLESFVHQLNKDDDEVVCIVADLLASWALDVANRCGISSAGFWPAMLATYRLITAIPDMLTTGLISDTGFPKQLSGICLPDQPVLSSEELPWLIGTPSARKARFKFWTRTLDRSKTLQWLLVNSFPNEYCISEEHHQQQLYHNHEQSQTLIFPIGPLSKHTTIKNPSFWEEDTSCLSWLDKQSTSSVVYISFGSWVSPIGEAKVRSLALSLEAWGKPFIWVLGSSWLGGLPNGFLERLKMSSNKQGKVVSWAPQVEVLQHRAVGCYLTHCGWNSTMEAIQCQKPLLCYPVAGDQFVNCTYIVKVWRIGVKLIGFGERDLEEGLRRVMEEGEMRNMLRKLNQRTMRDDDDDDDEEEEEASLRPMPNLIAFVDHLKLTNKTMGLS